MKRPIILTIASAGGGVGKTTIATSVAKILSEKQKVLLIDADNQAQASFTYGIDSCDAMYRWLSSVMIRRVAGEDSMTVDPIDKYVVSVRDNLDLLPSGEELRYAVSSSQNRLPLTAMRDAIPAVASEYDVVVVDSKPQDYLASMFWVASDFLIAPAPLLAVDMHKLQNLVNLLAYECKLARIAQPPVLILPNRHDGRKKNISLEQYTDLRESFAGVENWDVFSQPIPETVDVSHAFSSRVPLVEYTSRNITTRVAKDALYAFVELVQKRMETL